MRPGRKRKSESEKIHYQTISISGRVEELAELRARADAEGKTVSSFVMEKLNLRRADESGSK